MKHDKYKEGRLAQINDRRTIILSWFAVFHQLAKSGTLDLVRHPPHSEANVGDMHANARFLGYPEFLPQHHCYFVPPSSLFRVIGKKGGGKAWPAALQHLRRPWE